MTLWTLVIASVVYPLLAHVDVARGKNVGDVVTEIRIERTVYISPDWCADAEIGKTYPAQIDKGHTTVRLRVGQSTCKYHIVDTRPFLRRTPSPDLCCIDCGELFNTGQREFLPFTRWLTKTARSGAPPLTVNPEHRSGPPACFPI